MLYILSLLVCLFFAYRFDIKGVIKGQSAVYRCLLLWFILISALQYMVGTDMIKYVQSYQSIKPSFQIDDLMTDDIRYQPGWMFLCYLCRFITGDFFLLKLIHGVFINIAVFSFFKRESRYLFISIFFYALISYLVINFNVIRQSFAIGFCLYAYSYLKNKDYLKYLIFVFIAFIYHSSAILLIVVPLLYYAVQKKFGFKLCFVSFMIIIVALSVIDTGDAFTNIIMSEYMDEGTSNLGMMYLNDDNLGSRSIVNILSPYRLLVLGIILYYYFHNKSSLWGVLGLCYFVFIVLSMAFPILWRFRLYFDFAFFIILPHTIIEFSQKIKTGMNRQNLCLVCILVFCFFPLREYLTPYKGSSYRYIDQYYPYTSILNPEVDAKKQSFFDSYGL